MNVSSRPFVVAIVALFVTWWIAVKGDVSHAFGGTRQAHLDFHTSELIPDVGKHFSKEQFQAAL